MRLLSATSLLLWATLAQAQLMVPRSAELSIGGDRYAIAFSSVVIGAVQDRDDGSLQMKKSDASVICADATDEGTITIRSGLQPVQEAKALIHETVHIALTCDRRPFAWDERIAQDVADLIDSPIGPFVLRYLGRKP